jgi:alpha-tubulin suppressor-like RCC1 family protein
MRYLLPILTLLAILFCCIILCAQSRYNLPYQRIEIGYSTSFEIRNGQLFGAGWNHNGQLGDGTQISTNTFTQIGTNDNWVHVEGDYAQTLGLRGDGTLWAWGNNQKGNLGLGNTRGNIEVI